MTQWFIYKWEKPTRQKSRRVILRSPLSKIHYYHNKRLQIKESQYLQPTYSWTFISIPNWTCSVVTISHFQCTAPSTWLTNCADPNTWLQSPTREGCWLQSFSVYHMVKVVGFKVFQFFSSSHDEGCWFQSYSVHHMMKIKKFIGYKTLQYTNTVASSQERWTRANSVSGHNLLEQNFA